MKILIVAPHADDESLGCGGTISRFASEGHLVDLCIATKPYSPKWSDDYIQNRKIEISKSCEVLNINETFELNLNATKLNEVPHSDLNDMMVNVIKASKPDIIFIPFIYDLHMDHRMLAESAFVAIRPTEYKTKKIFMYETPSETEWSLESFKPNVYIDISEYLNNKKRAMKCYGSELKKSPHPRSLKGIETLAKKRGSEVNLKYAEGFILVREII